MISDDGSMILLELRDESTRQVSFAGVDLKKHKIAWEQNSLPEKWWIGIFGVMEGKLILHGYKDFQNPEHLGIYVLDDRSGKLIWKNEKLSSVIAGKKNLIARDPSQNGYLIVQSSDGKILKEFDEKDLGIESGKVVINDEGLVKNSYKYSTENNYFQKLASFIEVLTGFNAIGTIEYLEHKNKIITSFYFKREENLVNYLLICDEEGTKLFAESLAEDLKGLAEETFFFVRRSDHFY